MDGENVRRYGKAPYLVAVVHGGPGAAGAMAPVARELGADRGVLEPLQTAMTVDGQVDELAGVACGLRRRAGDAGGALLGRLARAADRRALSRTGRQGHSRGKRPVSGGGRRRHHADAAGPAGPSGTAPGLCVAATARGGGRGDRTGGHGRFRGADDQGRRRGPVAGGCRRHRGLSRGHFPQRLGRGPCPAAKRRTAGPGRAGALPGGGHPRRGRSASVAGRAGAVGGALADFRFPAPAALRAYALAGTAGQGAVFFVCCARSCPVSDNRFPGARGPGASCPRPPEASCLFSFEVLYG